MPSRSVACGGRRVLVLLAVAFATLLSTGTTSVSAATFTYDAPTITHGDVNVFVAAEALTDQVSGVREQSALPSAEAQGASTTPDRFANATNTVDDIVGSAKPWDLRRTETLAGRGSKAKVDDIASSMRQNGWVGEPIEVFQANGQSYVVNGHHRVAAARQAGIDVQYRVISEAELLTYYPGGVNQLVSAASEARPG